MILLLFVLWHVFGMSYSPQLSLMRVERYPFGVVFLNTREKMDFKLNLLFSHTFVLYLLGLIWTFFSLVSLTKRDLHESTFLVIKNFSRQNYGYCYPISYIHFLNASSLKVTHLKWCDCNEKIWGSFMQFV